MNPNQTQLNYDVIIVGAGPAGLATALSLAFQGRNKGRTLKICILEKSARIGGHLLSGALVDLNDFNNLIPDCKQKNGPFGIPVTQDFLYLLTHHHAIPLPRLWKNDGLHLLSLGTLCRWLAKLAEAEGVEIYAGFVANQLIWNQNRLEGIITGDHGRDQLGRPKPGFQAGIRIQAPITILAEGCHGFLTQQVIQRLKLNTGRPPQTYALGFKELWEISTPSSHLPGDVLHTMGWPLNTQYYGGGFLYQLTNSRIAVGFIVGLDYKNPFFDPFATFQQWKTHPLIRFRLQNGHPIGYGARTLVEGGWQAIPQLIFSGGLLVGDAAGFLNTARLKGIGNALQSGVAAANAIWNAFETNDFSNTGFNNYPQTIQNAPWGQELMAVRNIRPGFRSGLPIGLCNAGLERGVQGCTPWTLKWTQSDRACMHEAVKFTPIPTPEMDHQLTFDRSTLLALSALSHREDQPIHLHVQDPQLLLNKSKNQFANPQTRYCPAGVYKNKILPTNANDIIYMQATHCLHCKCCDIKDPLNTIHWTPPEGGSGPDYGEM